MMTMTIVIVILSLIYVNYYNYINVELTKYYNSYYYMKFHLLNAARSIFGY